MPFTGQLSDADRACMHERDEALVRDRYPLYRLMFSYPLSDAAKRGCVVRFQRLDDVTAKWVTLSNAVGNDEASAIRELRRLRHEFAANVRRARAEQAQRNEQYRMRLREAGINPRHGVYGGGR